MRSIIENFSNEIESLNKEADAVKNQMGILELQSQITEWSQL